MALPVFLASTRQLLVLSGSTYTTRLWCVMEICALAAPRSPHTRAIRAPDRS